MRSITAGSSITAMIFNLPPHCGQRSISMSNTRFSNRAQLIRIEAPGQDRITAYGLFIDPPLGRAGMTEAEIRRSGRKALTGKRPMTRVGRAVEKGETQGFMKITVDAETKQILGAAILGVGGDEAIHSILDVMYAKAPYTVLQRSVNIHPTVSELIPTILGELKPMD